MASFARSRFASRLSAGVLVSFSNCATASFQLAIAFNRALAFSSGTAERYFHVLERRLDHRRSKFLGLVEVEEVGRLDILFGRPCSAFFPPASASARKSARIAMINATFLSSDFDGVFKRLSHSFPQPCLINPRRRFRRSGFNPLASRLIKPANAPEIEFSSTAGSCRLIFADRGRYIGVRNLAVPRDRLASGKAYDLSGAQRIYFAGLVAAPSPDPTGYRKAQRLVAFGSAMDGGVGLRETRAYVVEFLLQFDARGALGA